MDHYCYNILFIGYKRLCPAIKKVVPGGGSYLYIPGSGRDQRGEENSDPKI